MRKAASMIRAMGAPTVLLKEAICSRDSAKDQDRRLTFSTRRIRLRFSEAKWIASPPVRGTGCMLSSGLPRAWPGFEFGRISSCRKRVCVGNNSSQRGAHQRLATDSESVAGC